MKSHVRKFTIHALILVGTCSCIGLLSDLWWFFDLFNHFRPQALLGSSFLLLIALVVKDRTCIALALSVITINFLLMAERLHAFPASKNPMNVSYVEEDTQTISVLFSNVLTSNSFHQSFLNMILKYNSDIIVTTEINNAWEIALTPLQATYPHSIVNPRPDNFGMAIYSKLPFKSERYDVGDYSLPLMVLDFDTFALIAAHPIPPLSVKNNEELHTYMRKIAEIVRNTKKPIILAGDLNATIWSNNINDLRNIGLERTTKLGLAWTWPSGFWPLAVQIDHIFVRDVIISDFDVLPYIGSDHFPVKSTITIEK